jgi:predicted Zn-dependent protease
MWLPMMTEWPGGRDLTDREVEAAAAHAMGHALGLPHSASPADVMFPGNTATAPSPDDLAALAALYSLPNGARISEEDGR